MGNHLKHLRDKNHEEMKEHQAHLLKKRFERLSVTLTKVPKVVKVPM